MTHIKIAVPDELLPGIRAWCATRRIVLQRRLDGETPIVEMVRANNPVHLTRRELDVLLLLADGAESGAIARQLTLSEYTVRSHVIRIMSKLGVHTRAAAVAQAIRQGYIT